MRLALRFLRTILIAGAALLFASPPALSEAPLACPDTLITVSPAASELSWKACDAATSAVLRLEKLGLPPLNRPVSIYLVEHIETAPPGCMALYDTAAAQFQILTVECLDGAHGGLGSFHVLPPDVLFESLIIHELTHAHVDQATEGSALNRLAHEYLAYAIQLEALDAADRETILSQTVVNADPNLSDFDDVLLTLHPLRFAVLAWLHFSAAPDPVEALARVLDGRTVFANALE